MKKINKARLLIVSVYLIHLLVYIGTVHIINTNIASWIDLVNKLKLDSNIDSYTHLYVHIYYFILSTNLMLSSLSILISKIPKILIFVMAYAFAFIGLYKYYDIKYYAQMIVIASGLILSLRMIYKKYNYA